MIEVVYSPRFGGFGLSQELVEYMGLDPNGYHDRNVKRDDPKLVAGVKELGEKANTRYSNLKIAVLPDGTDWVVTEYDGYEAVEENHRIWTEDGESWAWDDHSPSNKPADSTAVVP